MTRPTFPRYLYACFFVCISMYAQGKEHAQSTHHDISNSDHVITITLQDSDISEQKISQNNINQILNDKPTHFQLNIPDLNIRVDLEKTINPYESCVFKTSEGDEIDRKDIKSRSYYRVIKSGSLENENGLISISTHGVRGKIHVSTGEEIHLNSHEYSIKKSSSKKRKNYTCTTQCAHRNEKLEQIYHFNEQKTAASCPSLPPIDIYMESIFDFYESFDSDENATLDFLTTIFDAAAAIYATDGFQIRASEMIVWTTMDPYSNQPNSPLDEFVEAHEFFNGDVAMLFSGTGTPFFGTEGGLTAGGAHGLGGLGVVGNPDLSPHAMISILGYGTGITVSPDFTGAMEHVLAHEIGHVLGSDHTHACVWNGNNTAIDGCNSVQGSCSRPSAELNGGIMSYCTSEFSQFVGDQPGDVMRQLITDVKCDGEITSLATNAQTHHGIHLIGGPFQNGALDYEVLGIEGSYEVRLYNALGQLLTQSTSHDKHGSLRFSTNNKGYHIMVVSNSDKIYRQALILE